MPRRPPRHSYDDGQQRVEIKVPFTLTREEIYEIFAWIDAYFGYSETVRPKVGTAVAMLRRHVKDYGLSGENAGPDDEFDAKWVEAMTAAIWGEERGK